ncbi:GNAT family N-acetyltransferase [Brevundimonas lenta]|uniref:Putative N-acetyltransferase YhbS n=1 Tax=Brevundimonas lenta TaxID=424796 RepID=A0A7W6JGN2_9CAUL|nr:N-acetyltransferase [Brevundimonas lenta]MBB4083803.1 putative N-acetyltransferase YhbS [Brevundimonas lenta]
MTHAPATAQPDVRPWRVEVETPADGPAVEALVLDAFGPGRFAKTAERLREDAHVAAGFLIRAEGRVIGSVRLWTITVDGAPALFLGPIAVDAASRSGGMGADLVQACLDHAGDTGVLLVGEPPYFSRFGFRPAPDARLPGPVDQRRVMWLGAGEAAGPVLAA